VSLKSALPAFAELKLLPEILKAVQGEGYTTPTPIQAAAIPIVLQGKDLLGIAQTGTGKTAAFSLPMLQNLMVSATQKGTLGKRQSRCPRGLVLVPTRELAVQVYKSLEVYGKPLPMKYAVIFGGVGQGMQVQALQSGVDVLVATPGRLLDLIQQKHINLDKIEVFVLDEADRMLDMGFIHDVRKVVALMPQPKQNLFFSATMPNEVQVLADRILRNPQKVEVTPPATVVEKIEQKVYYVQRENKLNLLLHLLENNNLYKVIVFVDMKHVANKVADYLAKHRISSAAIHGNKSQNARQRAIEDFTEDRVRVLVATDIAARGIDIDGITHVINFDLPHIPESYVHRIGRTARAGTQGHALSFCTELEKSFLFHIEKTTRTQILVDVTHPFHSEEAKNANVMRAGKAKGMLESQRGHRGGGSGGRGRSSAARGGGGRSRYSSRRKDSSGFASGGPRQGSR